MKAFLKQLYLIKKLSVIFLALTSLFLLSSTVLAEDVHVNYSTHVEDLGNIEEVSDGETSGTTGMAKRLEGLYVNLSGNTDNLNIEYRTHIQNIGWQEFKTNNELSGTTGRALRLEALQINLTGSDAPNYDVYYRTHIEDYGWLSWAKNGLPSGSEGYSRRMEALQIKVLPKNSSDAPDTSGVQFLTRYGNGEIRYQAHIQNIGWQDYVTDGATAGTTGQNLRLEAFNLTPNPNLPVGSVLASAYVNGSGWRDYAKDTEASGTVGQSKELSAIKIKLTGDLANKYDIQYRVHVSNEGWKDWSWNDNISGNPGGNKIEALEVHLREKLSNVPSEPSQPDDSSSNTTQFQKDLGQLNKDYPIPDNTTEADKNNPYYLKRLIVTLSGGSVDFQKYNPVRIVNDSSDPNYYVLQFDSEEATRNAFEDLQNLSNVNKVNTVKLFYGHSNEENFSNTLANIQDSTSFNSWGVKAIGADKLADSLKNNNKTITVAVVDSGVASHPFIGNRRLNNGHDFVENDDDPTDENSHGTHVAGTIVDCTPNLNVRILPVRVLDEKGHGSSDTIKEGIDYAVEHGVNIINLSIGGPHDENVDLAIQTALSKGIIVVCSAGNDATNNKDACPAHMTNPVIVVSAVDSTQTKADFSNWGDSVDVAAPGVNIKSTVLDNQYGIRKGTSMAAPHVTAAAAMLKLKYPDSSPSKIEELITSNAKDIGIEGRDSFYGYGMLDLSNFINTPVYGEVVFPDSDVTDSGTVAIVEISQNGKVVQRARATASNPNFSVGLTPGKYTLNVSCSNCEDYTKEITVSDSGLNLGKINLTTVYHSDPIESGTYQFTSQYDKNRNSSLLVENISGKKYATLKFWSTDPNNLEHEFVNIPIYENKALYQAFDPITSQIYDIKILANRDNSVHVEVIGGKIWDLDGNFNGDYYKIANPSGHSYDSIIDMYKRAETGNITEQEKQFIHDGYDSRYNSKTYGYCFLDLDKDNNPELIINSLPNPNGDPPNGYYVTGYVLGIYTNKGGTVQQALKGVVSRRSGFFLTNSREVGYEIGLNGMWYSYGRLNNNSIQFYKTIGELKGFGYPSEYYMNNLPDYAHPTDLEALVNQSTPIDEMTFTIAKNSNSEYDWGFKRVDNY